MPVVVGGNGGYRRSNHASHYYLSQLASYGYFIIANSGPSSPYIVSDLNDPDPSELLRGSTGH